MENKKLFKFNIIVVIGIIAVIMLISIITIIVQLQSKPVVVDQTVVGNEEEILEHLNVEFISKDEELDIQNETIEGAVFEIRKDNTVVDTYTDTASQEKLQGNISVIKNQEEVKSNDETENQNELKNQENKNQESIQKVEDTKASTTNEVKSEGNPSLANTITFKRNASKEDTAIGWIKDTLAKDSIAIKYGYTVQKGTQSEAKAKTTGFSFYEDRVRNRVSNSGGGNFYVYVEDHYIYDSRGINQSIADTWIYVYSK